MLSFIETPLFTRLVYEYLTDEEYAALQAHLAQDPESGEVVSGSGGVRKLRWAVAGRGKRTNASGMGAGKACAFRPRQDTADGGEQEPKALLDVAA